MLQAAQAYFLSKCENSKMKSHYISVLQFSSSSVFSSWGHPGREKNPLCGFRGDALVQCWAVGVSWHGRLPEKPAVFPALVPRSSAVSVQPHF